MRRFFHVTLPALRPIIVAITTLDLINNFNSFALVYTLTAGGPGGKTMLPSLFVYNEAFQFGHWGYAAAMGNVMVDRRRDVPGPVPVGQPEGSAVIRGRHTRLTRPLQYLALAAFMIFLAFPVVFLLVTALKPQSELIAPDPSFLPKEIEWSNFTEAIDKTRFWTTARNSAVVATVTMAVTILVALPAAYALARFPTRLAAWRRDGSCSARCFRSSSSSFRCSWCCATSS